MSFVPSSAFASTSASSSSGKTTAEKAAALARSHASWDRFHLARNKKEATTGFTTPRVFAANLARQITAAGALMSQTRNLPPKTTFNFQINGVNHSLSFKDAKAYNGKVAKFVKNVLPRYITETFKRRKTTSSTRAGGAASFAMAKPELIAVYRAVLGDAVNGYQLLNATGLAYRQTLVNLMYTVLRAVRTVPNAIINEQVPAHGKSKARVRSVYNADLPQFVSLASAFTLDSSDKTKTKVLIRTVNGQRTFQTSDVHRLVSALSFSKNKTDEALTADVSVNSVQTRVGVRALLTALGNLRGNKPVVATTIPGINEGWLGNVIGAAGNDLLLAKQQLATLRERDEAAAASRAASSTVAAPVGFAPGVGGFGV